MASGTVPSGGQHFCRLELPGESAWLAGVQSGCGVTFQGSLPITARQRTALDQSCTDRLGTVVDSCPRIDVVAYCDVYQVPASLKAYLLIYRSALTPDVGAVSLNEGVICRSSAHALSGTVLRASCAGRLAATINGQPFVFSEATSCAFKSDGVRSEFYFSASNRWRNPADKRSLSIWIEHGGNAYTFGSRRAEYTEGGNQSTYRVFPYPIDSNTLQLKVSRFAPRGAALVAEFSLGTFSSQPSGAGEHRTVTAGTIDVALTPSVGAAP